MLQVQLRRFRCDNTGCPVRTFAEQVDGLTAPHARLTSGLRGMLTQIGLALAGRAGSRLASVIGAAAGRDTLLRLVKNLPDPPKTPMTVLGFDDSAFRRGRHYGTVVIDMASYRPVDMFDGRDGDSLAGWRRQHPEIEVICRDRAGGYGEGARDDRYRDTSSVGHLAAVLGGAATQSHGTPPGQRPLVPISGCLGTGQLTSAVAARGSESHGLRARQNAADRTGVAVPAAAGHRHLCRRPGKLALP